MIGFTLRWVQSIDLREVVVVVDVAVVVAVNELKEKLMS